MINRRKFLSTGLALAGTASIASTLSSCDDRLKPTGSLSGPNYSLGHRLRQGNFGVPSETTITDVVVVGGGVAGLTAARYLQQQNVKFHLLELEAQVGGNSASGNNSVSAYPWGAHYLPVPGNHDKELLAFLEETGAITGYQNGLPVYNEYYLCFDPKERLYIHNHWQDGLVPHDGLSPRETAEYARFAEMIQYYRELHGADGKEAFCIPVARSSDDPSIRKLDRISFKQFLSDKGFTSSYLIWYTNYCCADDFGSRLSNTSAWAGLHYFCSRKAKGANVPYDAVLTWPEGNGWLIAHLKKHSEKQTIPNCLVYSVQTKGQQVQIDFLDAGSGASRRLLADKVILATPQYINQRILSSSEGRSVDYSQFSYAPWMVANLTCSSNLNDKRGEHLSWDNVIYGSSSLGYVNANHQDVALHTDARVITYYLPLTGDNPQIERQTAFKRTYHDWYDLAITDLKTAHASIEEGITSADIWIWGHGMIRPSVGFISEVTPHAAKPLKNRIFFAHSDVSGLSIFEEAFYQGNRAAKLALA